MKVLRVSDLDQYNLLDFGEKTKVKILWLDDERDPIHYLKNHTNKIEEITWAKDSVEFLYNISDGKYKDYDLICLDHDLGNDSENGVFCAQRLREEIEKEQEWGNLDVIFIHSYNPGGTKRMLDVLDPLQSLRFYLRKAWQKTLYYKGFQYPDDLKVWVDKNIDVNQIVNISCSQAGPDRNWTVWYWELENKPIKNPDIKIE